MTGELWIPEAEDLAAVGTSGLMEGGQPKVTWHVTVCPSGRNAQGLEYFDIMHRVLRSKEAEPHLLWDPVTDRLGQYFALNRSARALRNDGGRRTNGSGLVNIQIEVVAMADDFTRYWKPGPNYRALMRAIRSWGVPDAWPGGDPVAEPQRSWSTYIKGGHFGHVHVPGNDHVDPQVRDGSLLLKAVTPQEDDMPTPEDLWNATLTGPDGKFKARARDWLTYANDKAGKAARDAAAALEVMKALAAKPQGLTAAEIEAAAERGAKAALAAEIDSATVTLNATTKEP